VSIDWSAFPVTAGTVLAFVLLYGFLLLLAKWMSDLLTPYSLTAELVKRDNVALGISVGGYFLATAIIFVGATTGPSKGFLMDLVAVGGYSVLGIVFLNTARVTLDKLILTRFATLKEIVEDRNCGVGAVRAGVYIATGLIAAGAVSGQGGGVLTAIVFFVLGQLCLVVFARLYDLITPYNLQHELESDNVAAGVAFGGTLVAIGIITADAVAGDFVAWGPSLLWFAQVVVIGMVVLPIVRFLMDRLVITGEALNQEIVEDRNIAAGLLEMTVAIAFAMVIAALI
jgi:uncharacterized membrane protein YjfL (UPF0719 family)